MSNVTIREYYNGADIWLRCTFYNQDVALEDPSTIDMVIGLPDGSTIPKTKADMVQWSEDGGPLTGHWQYQYTSTLIGFHTFDVTFTMANGDNGRSVGRFKVI